MLLGKLIKYLFVALAYIPRPVSQWLGRRLGEGFEVVGAVDGAFDRRIPGGLRRERVG